MGVVYLGRTDTGALAAIKVILPEYAADDDFRTRFRREVEAARRVESPWAVPVTGAETEGEHPWLATAFVPGPALAEAVARCGPLPARSVRVLGRLLARALTAVHAAGLVHRDVKPGNVLLTVDGPRLIDFGIARAADATALTATGLVVGTPGFLSPEQATGDGTAAGPASDVFSLGCLLAYAATGRPPTAAGPSRHCSTGPSTTSPISRGSTTPDSTRCSPPCWPRTPAHGPPRRSSTPGSPRTRPTAPSTGCPRTSWRSSPTGPPPCWSCPASTPRSRRKGRPRPPPVPAGAGSCCSPAPRRWR